MDEQARLARLEKEMRRYRKIIALLVLAVVALATAGAGTEIPEVLRARRFEVIDRNGRTLVAIKPTRSGGGIGIFNLRGEPAAVLTVDETSGGLLNVISSSGRNGVLILGSNADETGGAVTVYNTAEQEVITLRPDATGSGIVGAWDGQKRGQTLRGGTRKKL